MIELICPKHKCLTPEGKCMKLEINKETGKEEVCKNIPVTSTTLYWCSECNVPIFELKCPRCGEKGNYIATDLRPVFPEEKVLLAILLHKKTPLEFDYTSIWSSQSGYIIDGKKLKVSIQSFNKLPLDEIKKVKKIYDEFHIKSNYTF